jgi:hypothetical protein
MIMSSLLEIQSAVRRSFVAQDNVEAAAAIIGDGLLPEARLNIYRNTFIGTLTTALRLSFPAVHRLVGAEFFEDSASIFAAAAPPRAAYLNAYGEAFPAFLAQFAPAAALPYLADVARLEWAVNRALHALEVEPLDLGRLEAIDPEGQGRITFITHPSVGLVHSNYPVDAIWRAVITQDDAAMAAIDLESSSAWLLVERREGHIQITTCSEPAWRFACDLFAGHPLEAAIAAAPRVDASILLADHLARGRFADFTFADPNRPYANEARA